MQVTLRIVHDNIPADQTAKIDRISLLAQEISPELLTEDWAMALALAIEANDCGVELIDSYAKGMGMVSDTMRALRALEGHNPMMWNTLRNRRAAAIGFLALKGRRG